MDISSLPQELLLKIMVAAAITRGLKRAIRLRLVCKTFNNLFKEALFATDLLDYYCGKTHYRPFENDSLSYYEIFKQYIAFRTISPSKDLTSNSAIIRGTAEAYCRLAGTTDKGSIRECIEALSDFRVQRLPEIYFTHQSHFPPYPNKHYANILVASVCMNNFSVAKQVFLELPLRGEKPWNCSLTHGSSLFSCPAAIATRLGRFEILELFLTRHREPYTGCIMTALRRHGNIGTFEFLIQFKPPSTFVERGLTPWKSMGSMRQLRLSPDLGVFDRAYRMRKEFYPHNEWMKEKVEEVVHHAARNGGLELLRHLFDQGVAINPQAPSRPDYDHWSQRDWIVMPAAAANHHFDVVQLLLERGADLKHILHKHALPTAAAAGSLDIVRILLDYGADFMTDFDVNKRWGSTSRIPHPIVSAVLLEHVRMFNLFVRQGALTRDVWDLAMIEAVEHGLDSMVDMLNNAQGDIIENGV